MGAINKGNSTNLSQTPLSIDYPFTESEIKTKPRKNLGKNAKESGTDKLNYNLYIEPYVIR